MSKIKCRHCKDILEGDYKGTFKMCKCGKCYIDETEYYCRVGGDLQKDVELLKNDWSDKDDKSRDIKITKQD